MTVAQHNLANGQHGITPKRIEDEPADVVESNDINGTAETTMWGERSQDGYNPSERLPSCERHATKGQKFARLWRVNAGLDTHRANGDDVDHSNLGKVNENAREKRRIAETLASRVGLPRHLIERASDVAAAVDGRGFSLWGGRQAVAVAAVQHVAPFDIFLGVNDGTPTTADTVDRDGENIEIRREIVDRLGASDLAEAVDRLDKATAKVAEAA